jgi:hypothetical protein
MTVWMSSKHTGEEAVPVAVESGPYDARVDAVGRHIGAHFLIKPDHAPGKESELSDASTLPNLALHGYRTKKVMNQGSLHGPEAARRALGCEAHWRASRPRMPASRRKV